ncbi:asparagine synthase (glutamine-hydrolyzing) [Tautonia rosea]|uniref:asparagine synthase (glutamine-hydrolyzing) n=1 Tax=Tautonia rosea TaxID=2728037 RepID=UPI0014743663|nr:asparagine synthase (glutamine-hydrolyzing) [Tautonia rosea]
MCGFVCLWKIDDKVLARQMIERIEHRGPDETAVLSPANIPAVMAHCRLSIIGTADGSQPIYCSDNVLVANGEIYNYSDIRAILGESAFETSSDSETILQLFRSGQMRWVSKLDGMFAFVLATPERIIAARDPLGIKPLYVAQLRGGLAFASELKAFDGLGLEKLEAIEPGAMFDSRDGIRRWYRLPHGAAELEPGQSAESIWRELRLVLEEAVRKWMVADVEVGSFLSGGLDSSIIAALAARFSPRRLKTFAVGLQGSADVMAARRVAEHIGSDHHELLFSKDDLIEVLPKVVYHLESADTDLVRSAIPTHFATTLARRHVKAVLTGEGADELFAGYAYHQRYADRPRDLADELTRSLAAMHNINLQRVDRITMAQGLEARTPFLDRELIDFAQSIPVTLKLKETDDGELVEKWILRKACEDLLPDDLLWRKKSQFDEGSGTTQALASALAAILGLDGPVDRQTEAKLYERMLREQYQDPDLILNCAGTWAANRV